MELKLTQTVQKGGCAAKVAAVELRKILNLVRFPPVRPEVLVDGSDFDDAAVVQVSPELALVQTLDFFTPILDSPLRFGEVAAANALSDVYAMGGRPQTALAILAFPLGQIADSVVAEILQGASNKLAEAKTSLVGGHSIDDDTIKFGLSVQGTVHPKKIWSNRKAENGDWLILTKALGTGTTSAALKRGVIAESDMLEAIASMAQLNNAVDDLSDELQMQVHAATDVTGFGLLGHLSHLVRGSQLSVQLDYEKIPSLPKALEFLQQGFLTKAHRSNATYVEGMVNYASASEIEKLLLLDPQTSGGLLLAVSPRYGQAVCEALKGRFNRVTKIGEFVASESSGISLCR